MRVLLAMGLMLWATSAVADCPTRDDLDGGVRFEDRNGGTETFTKGRRNTLNSYVAERDGYGNSYVLMHGHYTVQITDYENGKPLPGGPHVRHTYKPRPPAPRPNMTWVGVSDSRDGADRYQTKETHVMGPMRVFTIGGCRYNSFSVTVTFAETGFTEFQTSEYLVDLGVGLLLRRWTEGGYDDRYRYTKAVAVK